MGGLGALANLDYFGRSVTGIGDLNKDGVGLIMLSKSDPGNL